MESIGKVLREARSRAGLTQGAVAKRAGISVAHLSQIEGGSSASPEFVTVARIAPVVGISLDQIASRCGLPGHGPAPRAAGQMSALVKAVDTLSKLSELLAQASSATSAAAKDLGKSLPVPQRRRAKAKR